MLVKILGGFDIAAAAVMMMLAGHVAVPLQIAYVLGILLVVKGIVFILSFNFGSIIDVVAGVLFLLMLIWTVPGLLLIIGGLALAQKGVISFL